MKNTKIMAVLAIFLVAVLFIGAASAAAATATDIENVTAQPNSTSIGVGSAVELNFTTMTKPTGDINVSWGDGTTYITIKEDDWQGSAPYYNESKHTYSVANANGYAVVISNGTTFKAPEALKPVSTIIVANIKGDVTGEFDPAEAATGESVSLRLTSVGTVEPTGVNVSVTSPEGDVTYFEPTWTASSPYTNTTPWTFTIAGLYTVEYTTDGWVTSNLIDTISIAQNQYRVLTDSGDDAFVYEHIDVNGILLGTDIYSLVKVSDGANPQPVNVISGADGKFYLTEAVVGTYYGQYYINGDTSTNGKTINIWYPEISLQAELADTNGDSIDGKTINKDTFVKFLINAPKVAPAYVKAQTPAIAKIVFTTPASGKTTQFGIDTNPTSLLTPQTTVGPVAAGEDAPAGTWTAQAEYTFPDAFSDYAKKSNTISFTLQSSTLTITAAKDSVVRSNPFTVTISGESITEYLVYLEGASASDVNPVLQENQVGFQAYIDEITTDAAALTPVWTDIIEGAIFKTDASGKRTIQYNTAANTEDKTYTVKVNGLIDSYPTTARAWIDSSNYDKVKVKVEKGAVTISASGDGSYYIGDEIKLTGTNTDSSRVFLFVTGQNLLTNGVNLKLLPTKQDAYKAENPVAVKTDNTWEYKWDTSKIALDTGAYTIYATSRLTNGKASERIETDSIYGEFDDTDSKTYAVKLSDSEYATVSVNLKQPFLSAVPSGTVIAQGDKLYVRGTAEGNPNNLMLYIFGPNFFEDHSITVEDDGTYEKKIEISSTMSSNQYFVVVQHPMYNGVFDAELVKVSDNYKYFTTAAGTSGSELSFVVWGENKLQGSQAADALTKMIDDSKIDDIYTKLTFTVAAPWIRITSPGDKAVGSKFTITGTTNLAVDDQILVEVMSSSFNAVEKTSTSTTSGVTQTTKVVAGEGADNTWSVEVDTTNWKLDEYTIKVNGIEVDVSTTTNFNLVEKVVTTAPTTAATTAVPTGATSVPTTTPTKTPGFGAFIALAGLGAVALLVLRRN